MGQRMFDVATDETQRTIGASYRDNAQKLLDERGGKPTISGTTGGRISDVEALKILDAMKNAAPPNIPRAQTEVNYAGAALRSAIDRTNSPVFGLPSIAYSALQDVAGLLKTGGYEAALMRIDDTIAKMADDATIFAKMRRDGTAALLEVGMSLELVMRNANGYAARAEQLAGFPEALGKLPQGRR
jgi:hypothetical protein